MTVGLGSFNPWQQILDAVGDTTSDAALYADGSLGRGDFQNLIDVVFERTEPGSPERTRAIQGLGQVGFFNAGDDLDFWVNATPEEIAGESAGITEAVARISPGGTPGATVSITTPEGTKSIGGQNVPASSRLIRITDPAGSDFAELFVLVGSAFGVELAYEIGDAAELDRVFGGVGAFGDVSTLTQAQFDASGAITVGSVDEVIGSTGSVQAQIERDMRAAGWENPPAWLMDDQRAMAIWITSVNEGFSAERTWNELEGTDAFKGRFGGLDVVMGQLGTNSLVQTIAEYTRREQAIRQSVLSRRGPGADTSVEYISGLIGAGWQPAEVDELLLLERQLKADPEALDNINDILRFQALPELTAGDFISFLQDGQRLTADANFTPGELFEGINDALRFQALLEQGLDISQQFATDLGTGDSLDIQSPEAFSAQAQMAAIEVARNMNDIERGKLGIERDDIIAALFNEEAPSGKSTSEVSLLLEKLGRERAAAATGLPSTASFIDALGRLRVQGSSNL